LPRQKLHWQAAETFWHIVRQGAAELETVTAADVEAARLIGQRYPDQDFSRTDRSGFAMMKRLQVLDVASFDKNFAVCRFAGNKSGAVRPVA
jgi:predicted nucleic acid-binding protein